MSTEFTFVSMVVGYVGLGFALLKYSLGSMEANKNLVPVRVRSGNAVSDRRGF